VVVSPLFFHIRMSTRIWLRGVESRNDAQPCPGNLP
jgi:hypothetical protein